MSDISQTQSRLLQEDWQDYLRRQLGTKPWVRVYQRFRREDENGAFFCALMPRNSAEQCLSHSSWELHIGSGRPGFAGSFTTDREPRYLRYGDDSGIEPFVHIRDFHGLKPEYLEVCEEFRLFHNLYHDIRTNEFIKLNEAGEDEPVIRIQNESIEISLKHLKQFLAAKEMHLIIYFDIIYRSVELAEELHIQEGKQSVREDNLAYDITIRNDQSLSDDFQSFSRLVGKKLILGPSKDNSGIWPYEEKDEYADFIVGVNSDGREILHTCDRELLENLNRPLGAYDFLTPVFFRRTVLTKYYNNPGRYSVEDGVLRCGNLWILEIDNNHPQYIIAWLGDLGSLPYTEQLHWKSYNVQPDGQISNVTLQRQIYAEFTDPTSPDLLFKYMLERFQEEWNAKFSWSLFLPLDSADQHYYDTLRVPLTNDQKEFDEQVLALAKILVDSLNEQELVKRMGPRKGDEKDLKGISKLERFLQSENLSDYQPLIKFMRDLYDLRHGVGHRKGEKYKKAAMALGISDSDPRTAFSNILVQARSLLAYLEAKFLPSG